MATPSFLDSFCGEAFWNKNTSWNTNDPILSGCFRQTALTILPCIFYIILTPIEVTTARNSKKEPLNWSFLLIFRMILTATAAILSLIQHVLLLAPEGYSTHVSVVDFYTPLVVIITFSAMLCLQIYRQRKGVVVAGPSWFFTLIMVGCFVIKVYHAARHPSVFSSQDEIMITYVSFVIYLLLFITCSIADRPTRRFPTEILHPRDSASYPSLLTFWWVNPLQYIGFKKDLELHDMFPQREEDKAAFIGPLFLKHCFENYTPPKKEEKESIFSDISNARNGTYRSRPRLQESTKREPHLIPKKGVGVMGLLAKVYGFRIVLGCLYGLCDNCLTLITPQLLKWLISFIENKEEPFFHGIIIVLLMFLISNMVSLIYAAHDDIVYTSGYRLRSGLTTVIYQKAMRLKNSERKDTTTGEIVNLMSVDANRVAEVIEFFTELCWAPVQVSIAIYFIYQELGYAVFAGVGAMILILPLNGVVGSRQQKIQMKQMKLKDERVKTMNEILNGMKVIKLYAWEESFMKVVHTIRNRELRQLRYLWSWNCFSEFVWACAPFIVTLSSFAVFVLSDHGNVLDAKKAFVSLTYFEIIRFPMTQMPNLISNIVQMMVSVKRLNRYLNASELEDYVERVPDGPAIRVEDANLSWEGDVSKTSNLTLRNINFSVDRGSLVAIVGSVGSGKSSLMSALLGEMMKTSGRVILGGVRSIAYVPQQAWIQNTSLKNNILFGSKFDRVKYSQVINVCEMKSDLEILPAGDETEIGEKGINLSGGQKQRVNLSRACYSDSDLYLLDDPLSAVDSHVGKNIFERVISSKTGMLRKKTRLLVTNNLALLPHVDQILVIKDGTISEKGTYQTLIESKGDFAEFVNQFSVKNEEPPQTDIIQRTFSMISEVCNSSSPNSRTVSIDKDHRILDDKKRLIEAEGIESGNVKKAVYIEYFRAVRFAYVTLIFLGYILIEVWASSANYWLSQWSQDVPVVMNGTTVQDIAQRDLRLGIYGLFGFLQAFSVLLAGVSMIAGTIGASNGIHKRLLYQVLRSPMSFFDTTPTGRIVNRFSKDIDCIDNNMPWMFRGFIECLLHVVATIVIIAIATPWFLIVIIPVFTVYYTVQRFYVPTSRQLRRLESVTLSPVYSFFSETLSGVSTIRAYDACRRFIGESNFRIDRNAQCGHNVIGSNRWLSIRLEFCGSCFVMFAALFAVLTRETIDPGLTGLSVSYALTVTPSLSWTVRMATLVETNIVSVERILQYCRNVVEAEWTIPSIKMNKLWPSTGRIQFDEYATRYRPGLDLVVKDINFVIEPREKIGIVGRTGAGKSTITLSLFRLIEAAAGKIIIDGVDIRQLGLHQLRKRLTIIPQDPVLFSGTLRFNLDPFSEKQDEELWTSLEHAHLKEFVSSLEEGLDYKVSEGGENLSVGQKQLICLSRALLRKTRILILDEATAAVDLETDSLIQSTIREKFSDCTIITIAHRLHTIMDSSRVLVLDQGKVIEFDSPERLLENEQSVFYSLAEDAGILSAKS